MMARSTTAPKSEIKIKAPETFDGKPEHVNRWLGSVKRYLDINSHIYDTDDKQVLFTLSYMQDGPAENWVEDFTEDAMTPGTSGQAKGYGNFATLKNLILADFGPANPEGTAMQSVKDVETGVVECGMNGGGILRSLLGVLCTGGVATAESEG